jgi:hypothetical protein
MQLGSGLEEVSWRHFLAGIRTGPSDQARHERAACKQLIPEVQQVRPTFLGAFLSNSPVRSSLVAFPGRGIEHGGTRT